MRVGIGSDHAGFELKGAVITAGDLMNVRVLRAGRVVELPERLPPPEGRRMQESMSTPSYDLLVIGSGPAGQKGSGSRDGSSAAADRAARPRAGARRPAGANTVGAASRIGSRARHNRFHRNEFVIDGAGRRARHGSCAEHAMLKITIRTLDSGVHLKLEGELAGSWVRDLENSWRLAARASAVPSLPVSIDLADCSRVDDAGHYLLALLHLNGTRLVASGVAMTDLVGFLTREWPVPAFPEEREAPCA